MLTQRLDQVASAVSRSHLQHSWSERLSSLSMTDWYIGQVEGEDPDQEEEGYTLVKYMEKKGHNRFVWGTDDILKTSNNDILLLVDPPIPVSNRHRSDQSKLSLGCCGLLFFFTCQCQYELKSVTYSEIFKLSLIKLT